MENVRQLELGPDFCRYHPSPKGVFIEGYLPYLKPPRTRRDDVKDAIISQLVARRKQLGLTQDEVNAQLNVADRLVSKWECGIKSPSLFLLQCWAEVLDCSIKITSIRNK